MAKPQASLDFLAFTFRYDCDLKGRGHRYLNVAPSKKALERERGKLRELTSGRRRLWPIPRPIEELNGHWNGWALTAAFRARGTELSREAARPFKAGREGPVIVQWHRDD
ncbi:MAG: hypothetical protein AB1898_19745 [Acidobacteriota bacterium]